LRAHVNQKHEEEVGKMNNLKRTLIAAAMLCLLAIGVFAQDRDNQKPPPKPKPPVVVTPPQKDPPPSNNQDAKKKEDKRGKP
jgi:hypothetical protein